MDTTAIHIHFNEQGICNYCTNFVEKKRDIVTEPHGRKAQRRESLIRKIKESGEGKEYDCIVGISGGVDSSWTLVQVRKLGLRPLAVHMDNGWNSELAQNNIHSLIESLNVDLYTHVIDWEEYRNMMNAFFDADVVDVELLYDNAMRALNWRMAKKYGIKYILSGVNTSTEGMGIPVDWNWYKTDAKNIKYLSRIFSNQKIVTFPLLSTVEYMFCLLRGIKWLPFLDYIDYVKDDAVEYLVKHHGYKPYAYKHYESVFTRFYQAYILPKKFNIDKRKMHLSSLIMSGQMSRKNAIKLLDESPYPSVEMESDDIDYFLKKMGWNNGDLDLYITRPRIEHDRYPSEKYLGLLLRIVKKIVS